MLRTLKPFAATVPKFNRAFAFNFAFDVTFDFAYNIQYSGRNVFLVPPSHKYSFIWLHGLGGSAFDWSGFFTDGQDKLVDPATTRVALLSAPTRRVAFYNDSPMPAWYSFGLTEEGKFTQNVRDVWDSCDLIERAVHSEAALLGHDYGKIVVSGFSQGCALALATALRMEGKTLGGVCGLSGLLFRFVPLPKSKARMPIFLYHGTDDDVIEPEGAKNTYKPLFDQGFNVRLVTEPGLGHTISQIEVGRAREFLSSIFV